MILIDTDRQKTSSRKVLGTYFLIFKEWTDDLVKMGVAMLTGSGFSKNHWGWRGVGGVRGGGRAIFKSFSPNTMFFFISNLR
jgi:hypothetical protein